MDSGIESEAQMSDQTEKYTDSQQRYRHEVRFSQLVDAIDEVLTRTEFTLDDFMQAMQLVASSRPELGLTIEHVEEDEKSSAVEDVLDLVRDELLGAMENHAPMHSLHEAYAIIQEEVDELWDVVKTNPRKNPSRGYDAHSEAIQVAAMACRLLVDLPVE